MARSILIVDDNAFIRKALFEIFKREEDFDICGEAENGRDAIEKAQQLRPDLIVLDLSMSVMNGLESGRKPGCRYASPMIRCVAWCWVLARFSATSNSYQGLRSNRFLNAVPTC